MKHKAHSFSPAVIKTAEGRVDSDFQTDAERVWNWKDPMMCRVFLLFFCFLAGWGRMTVEMRPDALERMVTQKGGSAEVAVSGTLDSISEKNGWCTMILTGVEIEDESVRKVLISCKSDLLEMCEEKILPLCGSKIHLTGTAMNSNHHGKQIIEADIPMSELFGYNTDLRSMTGGIGEFSYEFSRYEQAPGDVQKREVEARAAEAE